MDTNHKSVLFPELGYALQGAFYEARNAYGQFHKEKIYHSALQEIFTARGIAYVAEPRIDIFSITTKKKLDTYVPDFLIRDAIVVEIKASPITTRDMEMQLIEYLKSSQYELAYLVNFGERRFKPRRFIHTKDRKAIQLKDS